MNFRHVFSLVVAPALACALVGLGTSTAALAQVQNKDQQACINAVNKGMAKVSKTVFGVMAKCEKTTNGAGVTPFTDCLNAEQSPSGKIDKAKTKLSTSAANACLPAQLPDFALTTAAHASGTAEGSIFNLEFLTFSFGVNAKGTPESDCLNAVLKELQKSGYAQLNAFNKCKKDALKNTANSAAVLASTCASTLLPSGVSSVVANKCGAANLNAVFGVFYCASEPNATAMGICVEAQARCAACRTIGGGDDLAVDCDLLDNGTADSSCARDDYIAGDFTGTFQVTSGPSISGTIDVTSLEDENTSLTGSAEIGVAPADAAAFIACYGSNPVSGTVEGGIGNQNVVLDIILANANSDVIQVFGTVSGNTITGNFQQTVGPCTGTVSGTWTVTQVP